MGLRDDAERGVDPLDPLGMYAAVARDRHDPTVRESGDLEFERMVPSVEPDVNESPIRADLAVAVHVAWSRVMGDAQWLGKERQGDKYKYRGIDDVMNLVAPIIRKHGVMVIPVGARPEYTTINTRSGAAMNYCRTVSQFKVIGPRGDSFIGETPGEAFDNGDKSSTKAQSVALRTFYIQALALATNRPEMDPEYGTQHELGDGRRPPTPAEYAAEILSPDTSVLRLNQIKQELFANRAVGSTEVADEKGDAVRLVDLVLRVGKARQGS